MVVAYAQERERGCAFDAATPFTLCGDYAVDEDELRRLSHVLVPGYRGAATVQDVVEIPAEDLVAQALENAVAHGHAIAFPTRQRVELGEVVENGDSAARSFYRIDPARSASPGEGPYPRTMEMRREGGRWFVLPGVDLLGDGSGTRAVLRWVVDPARGEQNGASGF